MAVTSIRLQPEVESSLEDMAGKLDRSKNWLINQAIREIAKDGMTILLSTHDLNLAFGRFDRVLALRGEVVAYGTPAEVYVPQVLQTMYGGRLAILQDGHPVDVYVDEHGCADCT